MDKENISHHYAGVLLVTEDGKLIGQRRDDKPGIDNPGKVSTFGGTVEPGENPKDAAWRELVEEETNLKFDKDSLVLFLEDKAWRKMTQEWEMRHFYHAEITNEQLNTLEVYEGQGWAEITGPSDTDLVEAWRPVIESFVNLKKTGIS
jgi:8-oxo-dGTP pyrophosphatase MutT (NUDIX family)